jgi:hypothetical protein
MTTKGKILTLAGYTAALLAANGQPMPTATAAAPAGLSPLEQRLQELKNPAPWMSWGGDLRLRNEYFDNLLTLNPNVRLHEQNEKGAILSIANTSLRAANLTGYFIYKHDDRANPGGINPVPRGGDNADIYTFGGRLSGLVADHWKYAAEGACQFGRKAEPGVQPPPYRTGLEPSDSTHFSRKFVRLLFGLWVR